MTEQGPRESNCAADDCGLPIKYVTGPNYGRWVHIGTGRWQCAGYSWHNQNAQARPPFVFPEQAQEEGRG